MRVLFVAADLVHSALGESDDVNGSKQISACGMLWRMACW